MKKNNRALQSSHHTDTILDQSSLRAAWEASAPEPSPQTVTNIKQSIRMQAEQHEQKQNRQHIHIFWKPALAAAAMFMLVTSSYLMWQQMATTHALWQELTFMEDEIHSELDALEVSVWDALAELEAESPANEALLHAFTLQMITWED